MRYSLASRFQGVLLGTAIGEQIGNRRVRQNVSASEAPISQNTNAQLVSLASLGIKSLIHYGEFNRDDWHNIIGKSLSLHPLNAKSWIPQNSPTALIATLPVALFYHENEIKLRQNLLQALAALGQDNLEVQAGALALGYVIAQSLKEKVNQAQLIPQTLNFVGQPASQVSQKLKQVKLLLQQNPGLEQVVTELGTNSQPSTVIALAFYCYLSTLEDFRLCVRRAAQTSNQPLITGALSGALSGAYNSISGIPATLRTALSGNKSQPLAAWGVTNQTQMLELCDLLIAVWSGVYDRTTHQTGLTAMAAIAAPLVIRSP